MDISPQFLEAQLTKLRAQVETHRAAEAAAKQEVNMALGAIQAIEQLLTIRNAQLPPEMSERLGLTPHVPVTAVTQNLPTNLPIAPDSIDKAPQPSLADIAGNPPQDVVEPLVMAGKAIDDDTGTA